jgi:DNA-binding NarL/FixJ family response regulator
VPYKVLLADDHVLVRDGVKRILQNEGFEVLAEVSNGREAVDSSIKLHPDVALLDVSMPVLNGIDAAREIANACPRTKTILLTMYKEEQYLLQGLRSGITGYVLKTQAAKDLVQAIQCALQGEIYLSPGVSKDVIKAALANGATDLESLTSREREVLQLIAEGKTNKEIAQCFFMSVKTVDSHRRNIMLKLNIHETAGLVRHAIKIGLIRP